MVPFSSSLTGGPSSTWPPSPSCAFTTAPDAVLRPQDQRRQDPQGRATRPQAPHQRRPVGRNGRRRPTPDAPLPPPRIQHNWRAREGTRGAALSPARPALTPIHRLFGQATPEPDRRLRPPRPARVAPHRERPPRHPEELLDNQRGLDRSRSRKSADSESLRDAGTTEPTFVGQAPRPSGAPTRRRVPQRRRRSIGSPPPSSSSRMTNGPSRNAATSWRPPWRDSALATVEEVRGSTGRAGPGTPWRLGTTDSQLNRPTTRVSRGSLSGRSRGVVSRRARSARGSPSRTCSSHRDQPPSDSDAGQQASDDNDVGATACARIRKLTK